MQKERKTKNFYFFYLVFLSLIRNFDVRRKYFRSFSTSFRKRLLRRRARKKIKKNFGFSLTYSYLCINEYTISTHALERERHHCRC